MRRRNRMIVAAAALAALFATVPAGATPPPPAPATSQRACPDWGMYGGTLARTFSSECPSPITKGTAPTLAPKWAFKTEKTVTASPAVATVSFGAGPHATSKQVVYVGDWSRTFYALDAATGDAIWQRVLDEAPGAAFGPIVSSAAVADVPFGNSAASVKQLVFVSSGPHLFALRADTGDIQWVYHAEAHDGAGNSLPADTPIEIESSPVVHDNVLYVGVDPHNRPVSETAGVKGGLVALRAKDGTQLWKFEPDPQGRGCGGMWSSPVVDPARDQIYMATANCPHAYPGGWGPHIEAVTALDLTPESGAAEPLWSFQPDPDNRDDVDFGATPNLFVDRNGREVLGAGKKDATYYAMDPATGAELWRTQVAQPGNFPSEMRSDFAIGGFIGSTAIWEGNVYGGTAIGGPPYYHALDGRTGDVLWRGAGGPSYAASATVNGVVFSGALDNLFKAFDADTGAVLWSEPLFGPISSGPAIAGNSVYVGSGTSSSDLCAKELPINEQCLAAFDEVLGSTGGVHAFAPVLAGDTDGPAQTLLNGQGNQLDAYDLGRNPPPYSVFIPNAGNGGKDLNAQICSFSHGGRDYVLLGEDSDQGQGVPQGWGIFDVDTKRQVGKLIADYGATAQPEQYGCAIERSGGVVSRIFVSQVGAGSFTADDGQMIVFFASSAALDAVFGRRAADAVCPGGDCAALTQNDSDWCVLDDDIHTAGGMAIDGSGNVYLAENSPSAPPSPPAPGRVLRYGGPFPASDAGCFSVAPSTFIQDPSAATPSAIVPALDENGVATGNWYVSSVVFPPVVNEYDAQGAFVRNILPPGHGTPFGLAVDSEGTLYVADLGISSSPETFFGDPATLGLGPQDGEGSVLRVRFVNGVPLPPDVLQDGMDFPDGLGILDRRL